MNDPLFIDVTVCISMSKVFKVPVSDYLAEPSYDDEGNPFISYDVNEDLVKQSVSDNIVLPCDAWIYIDKNSKAKLDMKGWTVDDFYCVTDE